MNKRWFQLGMGTIMMLFLGLIYAWSIFRGPLLESFPMWTKAEISLTFTIAIVSFCMGIIIAGKLLAKISPNFVLLTSGVLNFIGFLGVSIFLQINDPTGSLIKLYLLYGVLCGFGVGMGYNTILSSIMGWFPDRSGLASGILLMGFGLGGLVLGSLIGKLIESFGIFSTFRTIGFAFVLASLIVSFFIQKPTEEDRSQFQLTQKSGPQVERREYSSKEMLSSRYFLFFYLWQITVAAGGLLVINSAVPIATFFGASTVVGLIVSIFNGAGRVLIGSIFDKVGNRALIINAIILLIGGGVLTLTALTNNGALLWLGLPIIGIAYGGAPALCSAIVRTRWGAKHYPVNFGFASTNLMFGAFLGPLISGGLQDRSGNFTTTFFMLLAFGVVAILLSFRLMNGKETA